MMTDVSDRGAMADYAPDVADIRGGRLLDADGLDADGLDGDGLDGDGLDRPIFDESIFDGSICDESNESAAEKPGDVRLPAHFCGQCIALAYRGDARCVHCGRPRPSPQWPALADSGDAWLGRIIQQRYLLTRRLGKGTTAAVYEAESVPMRRQFAIKIVDMTAGSPTQDQAVVRARLAREIQAIRRLKSPHIVPLYDVFELSETSTAVVMNFVDGQPLNRLMAARAPMDWVAACGLIRQIAAALCAVHDASLVHRDLKPANVMVEPQASGDAFVYLLDFGIVSVDDGRQVTRGFVGTPLYASPEQALGEPIVRQSDIYSMGVMLFEMIAGQRPFEADNVMKVLQMHVRQDPPALSTVGAGRDLPSAICSLVARMLAKTPDARPADAGEVISTIDAIVDHAAPAAASAAWVSRPAPPRASSPGLTSQTASGLGVVHNHRDDTRANAITIDTSVEPPSEPRSASDPPN